MSRISYVNGRYQPHLEAHVHIDERGMHFSDGVYEVIFCLRGVLICFEEHLERLAFSLEQLSLPMPVSRPVLRSVIEQVVSLNRLNTAAIYVQITRGSAPRAHAFPKDVSPSLIVSVKRAPFLIENGLPAAGSILTLPDERWARPDIKSICLLPNALAKQAATQVGAFEAVLYGKDGIVTEGSSSNVWVVQSDNNVITPPANGSILNGITRQVIFDLCRMNGIPAYEQTFTRDDLRNAKEIFLSGTTTFVKPINKVDNHVLLGAGTFPVSSRIAMLYRQFCIDQKQGVLRKESDLLKRCS